MTPRLWRAQFYLFWGEIAEAVRPIQEEADRRLRWILDHGRWGVPQELPR